MQVYEIVVTATVSETFRIIADSDEDAITRARLMFSNEITARVLSVGVAIQKRDTASLRILA